ncbi:hypothetical protein EPD60_14685 [Flaviaesturariibacter flavus]|uniref:Uncharacterized protein n=1 Tax=Flaviaesturariibacter flavus TaxID=2502780 RepID=A0A4R1B8R0_9BACT|nr:hypothetical protein [Flaviaesturariibacter flavus]TCJ12519.1 hypothetical protein EPD60_14685 [Flaviaesturariibacter flavus]
MKTHFLLLPAALVAVFSCTKPIYSDERVQERVVSLYFRDSTSNALLIGRSGEPFHADSIQVVEAPNRPYYGTETGYGQDRDTAGKFGVTFVYYTGSTKATDDDLTPVAFDKTYFIQLSRTDADTVRFEKAAGADVRLSWNGRFVQELPRNEILVKATIRK